jgi:hypothetical protein
MNRSILILLPSASDSNAYEWVEGRDTGDRSSHFGHSGSDVEANGRVWRGCNELCLLPVGANEDQKRERLSQVLEKMGRK